jgi:hypothetical protein
MGRTVDQEKLAQCWQPVDKGIRRWMRRMRTSKTLGFLRSAFVEKGRGGLFHSQLAAVREAPHEPFLGGGVPQTGRVEFGAGGIGSDRLNGLRPTRGDKWLSPLAPLRFLGRAVVVR